MPDYIFDTTVLSNFAAAGRLELLEARYRDMAITTIEVVDELRRGVKAGYIYLESVLQQVESINPGGWLRVSVLESTAEYHWRTEFDEVLGPGEASCLALAISRSLTLATDDLAARRLAQGREVLLTGTCGILIALVRNDALSLAEANAMLAEMIRRGYRSPVGNLDELV
jgi:predicted nucleic acid-binding protein